MMERSTPVALSILVMASLWLGAALLLSAAVAPAAFAVLPSRTLAGALVGRVLPVLFWSGMAVGVIGAALGGSIGGGWPARVSALVLASACAVAQVFIGPRIEAIRSAIGGAVDALDVADPRRQAFGRLHGVSVLCLGLAMLAALVVIGLATRTVVQSARASSTDSSLKVGGATR